MSSTSSPLSLLTSAVKAFVLSISIKKPSTETKMANHSRSSLNRSGMGANSEAVGVEYFWTVELNADNRSHIWTAKDDELEDDDEDFVNHTLFLKLAVLGDGAVPGEPNIVTLESMDASSSVQKGAIVNLTCGNNNMGHMDLALSGKVGGTFNLVSGSGPVHLSGNYLMEYPKLENLDNTQTESDESEELEADDRNGRDEDDEDEQEEVAVVKGRKPPKRKGTPKSNKLKQKAKMDVDDDEDDEEDDDDEDEDDFDDEDEDEDSEEKSSARKPKKPVAVAKETAKKGKAKTPVEQPKRGKKAKK
ncbi:mitotic apparatus protein p62 [Aplysia californica]|uniref:Mitotic apparatus protein p62 n=1 Tax=Aplysia californica TaxID=6500 RepID=A0ABM0ZVC2_APLCA|nr:mitotic apparatus protein p62 [Aplysia californica]